MNRGSRPRGEDAPGAAALEGSGSPPRLLSRVSRSLERWLARFLVSLMAVMVLDVTWQVTSRFLIRAPSSFTEELAGFLLIWIGLFGAAYGIRTRAHLGIDLLVARLSGRPRRAAEILAHLVVFLFALTTMTLGGLRLVRLASQLDQISASMGVGMWVVYLALPLSGLLIMVFSLEAMVGDRGSRERA